MIMMHIPSTKQYFIKLSCMVANKCTANEQIENAMMLIAPRRYYDDHNKNVADPFFFVFFQKNEEEWLYFYVLVFRPGIIMMLTKKLKMK